jgi:hypothetical protein
MRYYFYTKLRYMQLPSMMFHVTTGAPSMSTSVSQRVQKHRDGLRAAGLRPVQIWVPDTRREDFALECRRQSRLVQHDAHETETLEWLSQAADTEGWQ